MYLAAFCGNELTYLLGRLCGGWMLDWLKRHIPRVRADARAQRLSLLLYYHFANSLRAALPVPAAARITCTGATRRSTRRGLFCGSARCSHRLPELLAVAAGALWQHPSVLSVAALILALWRIWRA
jgi:hypothetical protein